MSQPYEGDSTVPNVPGLAGKNTAALGRGVVGTGTGTGGIGVFGSGDRAGVWAETVGGGNAIFARCERNDVIQAIGKGAFRGVVASSETGVGIAGSGGTGVGGDGTGSFGIGVGGIGNGIGVSGESHSETGIGVSGTGGTGVRGDGHGIGAFGFLGGRDPVFNQVAGVFGTSDQQGVMGLTTKDSGTGVYGGGARNAGDPGAGGIGVRGETFTGDGVKGESFGSGVGVHGTSRGAIGVFGESQEYDGVQGRSHHHDHSGVAGLNYAGGVGVYGSSNGGLAGKFIGDVEVTGDIRLTNADCAEDFNIGTDVSAEPGTVMVLGEEGALFPSLHAYDKRVAGVISGAGDYKPGIVLDKQESGSNRQPIALLGKVFCKVNAQYGAIEVGDLLTTSPTPGHAMKADDPLKAFGSVIGKALRPLDAGQGLIPILIALQCLFHGFPPALRMSSGSLALILDLAA